LQEKTTGYFDRLIPNLRKNPSTLGRKTVIHAHQANRDNLYMASWLSGDNPYQSYSEIDILQIAP
jgi:hypothetical protein